MSQLIIYTPQNGELLKTVLDAVAALLQTDSFKDAIDIMMIFAVCMSGYQFVQGKKLAAMMRFIVTSFIALYALFGLKFTVAIIDMQRADSAGHALVVDHVPLGIAVPAAFISGLGYGITSMFSDSFHMPDNLDYNKTGMIFGARTWLSATNASLSLSPAIASDMSSYIRQCIFSAKLLGSQEMSPRDLVQEKNLLSRYFEKPSPIYRVILHDGRNLNCVDAAKVLKAKILLAAPKEAKRLSHLMSQDDKSKFESSLEAATHEYFKETSKKSADILTQNILINATRDAAADAFSFSGADAQLMNYTNTTSMQKMHVAEANSFWLASYRLPYYMSVMWMLTICIFPLVLLISFLPTMNNVYYLYLQSQIYLWSWPPMFIIIHFFVSLATAKTINIWGGVTGGATFSNIDALANIHSNFAYTAGALAASVPVLAYYITKGLSSVMSTASQHFGGMAQSISVSEAQSASQGNISMASYSGWNMNYDNTNAHKFDTNFSHASGKATAQMPNGALLSENENGSRVGNVAPAISTAAVSVHASDRVVDSLNNSANESFSHAKQLRAAADDHLQAGLSEMKNFTENNANDYRSGAGISNTETDSYSKDLRKMEDAVQQYNKHHDTSHQISGDVAISGRINTNRGIFGKAVTWVTGASIDGSATGRTTHSKGFGHQEFDNSSEGKSFHEAYNHMLSTARHNHLDAADSKNLSQSEQIAANFASGQSYAEQSSSEYSHGLQLQQAATHAREHAESIDNNLNQAFHDWAVDRQGEYVMLQTDSQSIATQNKWVAEFLNSKDGQNAISSQVNATLGQKGSQLHAAHQSNADELKTVSVRKKYNADADQVLVQSERHGFTEMDNKKLKLSNELKSKNNASNIEGKSEKISHDIEREINYNHKEIRRKKGDK